MTLPHVSDIESGRHDNSLREVLQDITHRSDRIEAKARDAGRDLLASEAREVDQLTGLVKAVHARAIELKADEERRIRARKEREDLAAEERSKYPHVFASGGRQMSKWETEDRANAELRNFLTNPDSPRQLRVPVGSAIQARQRGPQGSLQWDTGSVGSAVPTHMASALYETLEAEVAMLRLPTTKIVTDNGANFEHPKLTTHSIGTQVIAQGTAIGGTDPSFDKVAFGAYKYGQLVQVAFEVIEDSAVDITGFIMRDAARALGRIIDQAFATGSGTGEPMGIFSAGVTGAAGTVATGGTAVAPTFEKLIDTQYSIADSYRNSGRDAWLMSDSTAATLRKLRDGAGGTIGAPIWAHSTTSGVASAGQPSMLLESAAFVDAYAPSIGTAAAKIMAYGDWGGFGVRLVNNVILERDDSFAFDKDLVTFRAKWRVDSRLLDATALNYLNAAPS